MRGALYALVNVYVLLYAPILFLLSSTPSKSSSENNTPVAVDDHYTLMVNCNNDFLSGNLFDNDLIDSTIVAQIAYVVPSDTGRFTCDPNGNFIYFPEDGFTGTVSFTYCVWNTYQREWHTEARVYISIKPDSDCDNVPDDEDIDNDNDGILNIHEGSDDLLDSDNDGIPDCFDIDSDNDGITDLIEWQQEGYFIQPKLVDENRDGWDDAFDAVLGGDYYEPVDTDLDGVPDYIDQDSDHDGISDYIEANDLNNDFVADLSITFHDEDMDGLDDAFDTVNCCSYQVCTVVSNAALPDFNQNNVRNWRDVENLAEPVEENAAKALNNLLVYPNPTTDNCTVAFLEPLSSSAAHWQCHLYNQSGNLVMQFKIQKLPFNLNFSNLPCGTYHLQIFDKYNSSHATVIKTN